MSSADISNLPAGTTAIRQGAAAGNSILAGLGGERFAPSAQRARQPAISHQRGAASGRSLRLYGFPRQRLHRQRQHRRWRTSIPVWTAHDGTIDITPKNGVFNGGGSISVSGGSRGTISPFFEYGGTFDQTQYYVVGRYFGSNEGIENPAPTIDAIHDHTDQGKFFGYVSTVLGDGSRLSLISGASDGAYQISNNPGQTPAFTTPGFPPIDLSQLNENQYEQNYYNVLSWQKSTGALDMHVSAFSRYSSLNFLPDPIGDLQYNGVASNVFRSSFLNGVMGDGAYRLNNSHTLRFGFTGSGENATADNELTVFPVDGDGNVNGPPFAAPAQQDNKTGWLFGTYLQDEWRITDKLTLNAGLRFDQMYGYVDANQFSPRVSATYKPTENTTFHAGYARISPRRNFRSPLRPTSPILPIRPCSRASLSTIPSSRSGRTISTSASIRRSCLASPRAWTPIIRSRPICSTTASSGRP